MRTIQRSIDIEAPPVTVWQVLTATDRYGEWNPFMPELQGHLRDGERLQVVIRPGARTMRFKPTVVEVKEGTVVRWLGRLGVRGVFDGEHELRLHPTGEGGTRFTQRETFSGVLVPMLRRTLDDTATGFAEMNAALRDRAVAVAGGLLP